MFGFVFITLVLPSYIYSFLIQLELLEICGLYQMLPWMPSDSLYKCSISPGETVMRLLVFGINKGLCVTLINFKIRLISILSLGFLDSSEKTREFVQLFFFYQHDI